MAAAYVLKDADWVRQAFLVASRHLTDDNARQRTFSTVSYKYTDTTPGGNLAINPPPQFTRTADIPVKGVFAGSSSGMGNITDGGSMGRYYSEAIDDNAQLIYIRLGVPRFNSLTTFFTGFYDSGASQLARTGRVGGAFYRLGQAIGFVISIIHWKIIAIHLTGLAYRFATGSPSSKFYYLKPTMPVYWTAVTTIVNQLSVNRGIVPRLGGKDQERFAGGYEFDDNGLKQLHNLLPDIFSRGGGIDVYALANRAQRLARKRYKEMKTQLDMVERLNLAEAAREIMTKPLADDTKTSYNDYIEKWLKNDQSKPTADPPSPAVNSSTGTLAEGQAAAAGNTNAGEIRNPATGYAVESIPDTDPDSKTGFWEFFTAELDDGSAFATFRVNSTGSVSESFSNSVTESELAQQINNASSSARSTTFDFAGGNIVGGVIGDVLGGVFGAVKNVIAGAADGLGISGLAALAGTAFVDIPKHWQSSSASLPRSTYTINLVSPYGNPISQMLNLDIPLAMLLAAALPLATGKQSYTSPFILELYDRGRCQTRLGMIDSLSITRGTSNLGFNNDGHALAIDVSFSIVDMSSVLTMPIRQNFNGIFNKAAVGVATVAGAAGLQVSSDSFGPSDGKIALALAGAFGAAIGTGMFDDDTVFTDYMNVLAGMNLQDQIYTWRKFKLNATRAMKTWESFNSPANWAGMLGDIPPARLWSGLHKGIGTGTISGNN